MINLLTNSFSDFFRDCCSYMRYIRFVICNHIRYKLPQCKIFPLKFFLQEVLFLNADKILSAQWSALNNFVLIEPNLLTAINLRDISHRLSRVISLHLLATCPICMLPAAPHTKIKGRVLSAFVNTDPIMNKFFVNCKLPNIQAN